MIFHNDNLLVLHAFVLAARRRRRDLGARRARRTATRGGRPLRLADQAARGDDAGDATRRRAGQDARRRTAVGGRRHACATTSPSTRCGRCSSVQCIRCSGLAGAVRLAVPGVELGRAAARAGRAARACPPAIARFWRSGPGASTSACWSAWQSCSPTRSPASRSRRCRGGRVWRLRPISAIARWLSGSPMQQALRDGVRCRTRPRPHPQAPIASPAPPVGCPRPMLTRAIGSGVYQRAPPEAGRPGVEPRSSLPAASAHQPLVAAGDQGFFAFWSPVMHTGPHHRDTNPRRGRSEPLPSPDELERALPLQRAAAAFVGDRRARGRGDCRGEDRRLLVIVGPC